MALPNDYFKTTGTIVKGGILGTVPKPPTPTPAPNVASTAAAKASAVTTPIPTASVPAPPQYTADQQAHQAWINKAESGQGGMDAYTARQNQRWTEANNSGDTDLINRLKADSERVGYTLNPVPKPPSVAAAPQTAMSSSAPTPVPAPPGTINTTSIQNEAAAQMAKRRAAVLQAVEATKAGLKNSYDYTRQQTNDSRVLENQDFNRNTNPFSGKTGYLAANLARSREQTDKAMMSEYNSQVAAAQQKLADFDTLAPEQQAALVNELTRIERDYGLNVGQLMGTFNGQRTLAGSQFDWSKDMDVADRTGYLNGSRTLQGQQVDLQGKQANWNAYGDMVGWTGNLGQGPTSNWGDLVGRSQTPGAPQTVQGRLAQLQQDGASLNNELAKLELQNYPEEQRLKIEQLKKQIAQIGKAPYRSAEEVELDRVKLETAKEQLSQLRTNPTKAGGFGLDDYKGLINQQFYGKKDMDGNDLPVDTASLRNYIIMLNLSDDQTDQLLRAYGLPTN